MPNLVDGDLDRISQLPECIVHHILSFINTHAELVRTSVLSKKWFDLTASFPILDFRIENFRYRESFFKYVEYTTSRFCHQNLTTAHTIKLITTLQEPAELDIVNRCLELVLKNGVRELEIDITHTPDLEDDFVKPMPKYRLPNMLLSVSVLKSLTITGCELPSSLMVDVVMFKSLILLQLENVHIDDEMIKYLTTSCPLLRELRIRNCDGVKRFCVYGHQNLEKLIITLDPQVERMDIEAPNLSTLLVADRDERGAPQMNLASCKKLKKVAYIPISNGYSDFVSNFPFIETLVLVTEYRCNNLKLSSDSLRTLLLHSKCELEDIEFTTPNLVLFIYSRNRRLLCPMVMNIVWPLVRHLTLLKACMHCYPDGCIDALWFQKLRLFLDKKSGFKVLNLYIHATYSQKFTELEKLKAIELPPYELEHVELQLETNKESSAHIAFLDAVLWCCRPRSLTLRSSFPLTGFEDVVKFTYEKLLEQEDERHTEIQIVSPSSSKAQKHFRDWKSWSLALRREGNAICFIKEEVVQEEADSPRCANMKIFGCFGFKSLSVRNKV